MDTPDPIWPLKSNTLAEKGLGWMISKDNRVMTNRGHLWKVVVLPSAAPGNGRGFQSCLLQGVRYHTIFPPFLAMTLGGDMILVNARKFPHLLQMLNSLHNGGLWMKSGSNHKSVSHTTSWSFVGGPTSARQCATKSLADIGAGCKNLFIRVGRRNFALTCQFTISTDSMRLLSYFKTRINITPRSLHPSNTMLQIKGYIRHNRASHKGKTSTEKDT